MLHNHNLAYRRTEECLPLAKEGDEYKCVQTVTWYFTEEALTKMKTEELNSLVAAQSFDPTPIVAKAQALIAEVEAVVPAQEEEPPQEEVPPQEE